MLSHAFMESVSTGYCVRQQNCWVTRLNPEKWQERPRWSLRVRAHLLVSLPPSLGSLSQEGGPSQPQPACPYRGPLVTVLSR